MTRLIEFQSTVDRFMAPRVLNYLTDFYLDHARAHRDVRRLPPIFPLVLYNGDRRWSAATEFADLIDGGDLLGQSIPRFAYYKIAENEIAQAQLLAIGNIVATLFLAEPEVPIATIVAALVNLSDREEDKQAVSILVQWFKQMMTHGRIDPEDYAALATTLESSAEVKSMFLKTMEREKQAMFDRGWQEGRDEGRTEGRIEGLLVAARGMLGAGISPELVAQATGLALEQVLTLAPSDIGSNGHRVDEGQQG